ncbi:hypothetical protein [Kitasatospora sp. NPDC057541]|uniref:hypothetical protein n=1 Tax=unclassified Kitasatospora TaxID=2633591 RepID=UPI0036890B58
MDETAPSTATTTANQQSSIGGLTDAERHLVGDLHVAVTLLGDPPPGYQYVNVLGLLLDVGRLFTPRPWPDGGTPPGEPGKCYTESVAWAWGSPDGLAYVEGVAWTGRFPLEHGWCSSADGLVLDPTWPVPAAAYLGLPVRADAAAALMSEHGDRLLGYGTVCLDWLRTGVPGELLVDVGRQIPAELTRPTLQGL